MFALPGCASIIIQVPGSHRQWHRWWTGSSHVCKCQIAGSGSILVEAVAYQDLSQLTFRTARTWPDTGLKLLFKVWYDILSLLLVILIVGSLYYLCNIFQYLFDICLCCRIVQVWRLVILLKSGPIELQPPTSCTSTICWMNMEPTTTSWAVTGVSVPTSHGATGLHFHSS